MVEWGFVVALDYRVGVLAHPSDSHEPWSLASAYDEAESLHILGSRLVDDPHRITSASAFSAGCMQW